MRIIRQKGHLVVTSWGDILGSMGHQATFPLSEPSYLGVVILLPLATLLSCGSPFNPLLHVSLQDSRELRNQSPPMPLFPTFFSLDSTRRHDFCVEGAVETRLSQYA